ncbi:MAG: hypothetical protein PHR28_09325 [candidate division Zixibacteria bacterium]|jgi:hypothetical protein|nr:hypothetical protein [candidate division Zixibacteria bacterium]
MKDVDTFFFGQRQKETFISNFKNLRPSQFGEMKTLIANAQTAYKSIVNMCDKCDDMMIAALTVGEVKGDLTRQRKDIVKNIQTLETIKADMTKNNAATKQAIKRLDAQITIANKRLDTFDTRFAAFVKKTKKLAVQ